MKIWKYYLIPDKDEVRHEYQLYAFTNKKEFANKFENERDMKKFIKGDITSLDKDEYISFANDNQDCLLDIYKFETKYVEKNGIITLGVAELLTTYSEYISCTHESVEDMVFDIPSINSMPSYKIFNKKIIKYLKKIEFVPFFKLMANDPIMNDSDDDYSAPDLTIDEFQIFIKTFGALFK